LEDESETVHGVPDPGSGPWNYGVQQPVAFDLAAEQRAVVAEPGGDTGRLAIAGRFSSSDGADRH
jgi:hypothetical protein